MVDSDVIFTIVKYGGFVILYYWCLRAYPNETNNIKFHMIIICCH